jgi:hypothetical protein
MIPQDVQTSNPMTSIAPIAKVSGLGDTML